MTHLTLTLFGAFQARVGGRPLTEFATDKARALLAYLAVERDYPHRREALAALLWPEQPEARARQSLRQALSHLRQALCDNSAECPFLLVERNEVQLNPAAVARVDVTEFVALAQTSASHHHRRREICRPCLQRAEALLALYRGEFLNGLHVADSAGFEEWALLKGEWLHLRAVESLMLLADFHERRGELEPALRYARRLVELDPWCEEAHRQLMRLLLHSGQRSAALAQYETCRRVLQAEFGAEPTVETAQLRESIRQGRVPLPPPAAALPTPLSPFVGRAAELRELSELLAAPETRLVTLTGPGGIGKTRLALETARAHIGLYPDGVYWVALDALPSAVHIVPAIAESLGLTLYGKEPPETQLLNYLREKSLLLALDNAEHLPELGALAAQLLRTAPTVVLLVTSRERLALREEWVVVVEGLEYQAAEEASPPAAHTLFVQTARRVIHNFTPGAADLAAIAEICRLVEGMPLAVELAAPWIAGRSCAALARDLAGGLDVLQSALRNTPERHRSVRAAFAYSWTRLPEAERRLFAGLAVFRGSFTLDAARAVAGAEAAHLPGLVAQSLVRCLPDGRYQLHGLLRQFAAEKLPPDEALAVAARHAAFYAALLDECEDALKGRGQEAALRALTLDSANVYQAWAWATEQPAPDVFRRGQEGLFVFLSLRSWYQEGAALFAQAADAVQASDPLLHGELLARQGRCSEFIAPAEEATALYERSLALLRGLGAEREAALPLYGLGYMAHLRGDYAASRQYLGESLALYETVGNRWGAANVLSSLCLTLRRQGDFAAARAYGQRSLDIRRALGDRRGIASSQNNMGLLLCALGEYPAAELALRESLALCRELSHTVGAANALTSLCQVAFNAGDIAKSIQYQQEALALFREVGDLWGVALAQNNLGQLELERGAAAAARPLLEAAVAGYRRAGVQSGLTNALSNLGRVCETLGEFSAAAGHLQEALALSLTIGDLPFGLEVLARAAALLARYPGTAATSHALSPATVLDYVLNHPALLEETRNAATKFRQQLPAPGLPDAHATLDFQTAAEAVQDLLEKLD